MTFLVPTRAESRIAKVDPVLATAQFEQATRPLDRDRASIGRIGTRYVSDIEMKVGDDGPLFTAKLVDLDGTPAYLNGARVRFKMKRVGDDVLTIDDTCRILDPEQGQVAYDWEDQDTADPGAYVGVFDVDYDGTIGSEFNTDETFPRDGYLSFHIHESVG